MPGTFVTEPEATFVPSIRPLFGAALALPGISQLAEDVHAYLCKIVNPSIFDGYSASEDEVHFAKRLQELAKNLPHIHWQIDEKNDGCLSVTLIAKKNAGYLQRDFARKLLTEWLIPEKSIHILAERQLEFFFDKSPNSHFYFVELFLELSKPQDKIYAFKNMPDILGELRKGVISSSEAHHILNARGMSTGEKDLLVLNEIRGFLQRRSHEFDKDVLNEIQQFLFQCPAEFKQVRDVSHIARVGITQYLFRRTLLRFINKNPRKRHVCLKIFRTKLALPFGEKCVTAGIIGVNALNTNREVLEEKHVLEAVQNILPNFLRVKGSFIHFFSHTQNIKLLYFEVSKSDGSQLTAEQLRKLKLLLPTEIKNHVEHLVPTTFMRRNEEEVYRNIITLRDQVQHLKDIPQVMISFEEQTVKDLYFTVVLLRVLESSAEQSVEELFKEANPMATFIPDRRECVGYVKKKYQKEANVFRVQLSKGDFLRKDRSVDLYKARHFVSVLITNALGKIRDYNGGLILKQDERLQEFFRKLPGEDKFLLENFFYSIAPIAMQSVLDPACLKEVYLLFKKAYIKELDSAEIYTMSEVRESNYLACVFRTDDNTLQDIVTETVNHFPDAPKEWASFSVNIHGTFCFGYIIMSTSKELQGKLQGALKQKVEKWEREVSNRQMLRINLACKMKAIDPRVTRTDNSAIIVKMLYEGLTRIGKDRKPQPAIAERIDVSEDRKTYTFHLRNSIWTDKSTITAHDFEYSWKKVLENPRHALYEYTFGFIKNARDIFRKKKKVSEAGITALDDRTLRVELQEPVPFFLELTSHWTYLLINSKVDRSDPGWAYHDGDIYVCNGPFMLKEWRLNKEIVIVKNPYYWDHDNVSLEQITVSMVDNPFTEMRMFKNDEIDFGTVVSSHILPERVRVEGSQGDVVKFPVAGVFGIWINVRVFPFTNKHFRQALNLAVERNALQPSLTEGDVATRSIVPKSLSLLPSEDDVSTTLSEAKRLFALALKELGISRDKLPVVRLSYSSHRRRAICEHVQQVWMEAFGITVELEEYDWGTFHENVINDRHHVAGLAWNSWFSDPHYVLSSFSSWVNEGHITKWHNEKYTRLLNDSSHVTTSEKRQELLRLAEKMLMDEVPVIPLYQYSTYHLIKPYVKGVYCSEFMETDFKWAYIDRNDVMKKSRDENALV